MLDRPLPGPNPPEEISEENGRKDSGDDYRQKKHDAEFIRPDIEAVDITSRVNNINNLVEVTTKPIIFDGDTGGKIEHFVFTVRTLERLGVSAIMIRRIEFATLRSVSSS